jgi:hypothetical protein
MERERRPSKCYLCSPFACYSPTSSKRPEAVGGHPRDSTALVVTFYLPPAPAAPLVCLLLHLLTTATRRILHLLPPDELQCAFSRRRKIKGKKYLRLRE